MSKNAVIIVAGGSGTRMKSAVPKQFLEINGVPVILHTLNRFITFDPEIFISLVLPEDHLGIWEGIVLKHDFRYPVKISRGGETRFHSVKNGLDKIKKASLVGIHDAVRPLVSIPTLQRVYQKAHTDDNAIPVMTLKESIRKLSGADSKVQDRSLFMVVQTPQVFRLETLKKAYKIPYNPLFTDDASVVEAYGEKVNLVDGNVENIKITDPTDLIFAQALLGNIQINS